MALFNPCFTIWKSGIDANGRDHGETQMMICCHSKKGLYISDMTAKKSDRERTLEVSDVAMFRESDVVGKSVIGRAVVGTVLLGPLGGIVGGISGTGKKDAWFIEIKEADGSSSIYRLKSEGDGKMLINWIEKNR